MTSDDVFTLHRGIAPVLLSLPHVGTHLPDALRARLVERAALTEDTDWHLERLYAFVRRLGVSVLVPRHSRYLIDLNRPPENAPMYPGVNNTELCPTRFFTGDALYREGQAPDAAEVQQRLARYWRPYHEALQAELERLRARHGHVVLFDGHSIKSELPWLFDGRLPDLNLGTANGASCAPSLRAELAAALAHQTWFTQVVDGRFKGGYMTRRYGRPDAGVHAVQLEMGWRCYMAEEAPYRIDPQRTQALLAVLRQLVQTLLAFEPAVR